jgi:hypothetical protein
LGASAIATVNRSRISPSLQTVSQFLIGGKQYVVALTPDFQSFIGRPNMLAGVSFVAARPGSTISIYALGCGPTNPATQGGVVASVASPLALLRQCHVRGNCRGQHRTLSVQRSDSDRPRRRSADRIDRRRCKWRAKSDDRDRSVRPGPDVRSRFLTFNPVCTRRYCCSHRAGSCVGGPKAGK